MDFSYLLELAKNNEERSKTDTSFKFSTQVSTAKKVKKPGPTAAAVNQVLSKIEKDKQKKEQEYLKKRNELLALRANDKHSKKRVRSLINRTKGASKAVLEDAKDLSTAKGEEQCDEDDYGYESTISQQIFSKLQNKYSEMPDDERLKFNKTAKSNIEDIKKRVMSSLKQKQEEDLGIRKRKRKRKSITEDDGFINDGDEYEKFSSRDEETPKDDREIPREKETSKDKEKSKEKSSKKIPANLNVTNYKSDKYDQFKYDKGKGDKYSLPPLKGEREREKSEKEREKEKKKPKAAPPPMSFEELMKVAQKKQANPSSIVDPLLELQKKKLELEKKREIAREAERPLTAKERKELEEDRIRKLRKLGKLPPEKENDKSKVSKEKEGRKIANSKEDRPLLEKALTAPNKSKYFAVPPAPPKTSATSVLKPSKSTSNSQSTPNSTKPAPLPPKPSSVDSNRKQLEPKNVSSENNRKQLQAKNSSLESSKKHIASNSKEPRRMEKPQPPRRFPPPNFPRKPPVPPPSRRIASDSEEEYDSEMDDFIDDGEDEMDYSSEIAKMFKYDKSKYRNVDEDVDDMEVSYSQVEKEEKISARIGLMEDLADIKREEDEKKRKKMMMKKRK